MSWGRRANITAPRINCRLPQTPRTPSTAAAHYFDDIFSRTVKTNGNGSSSRPNQIRRSSTHRSIGNRSSIAGSVNGDEEARTRSNSVYVGGPEEEEEKKEANKAIAMYVSEQLERVRSSESVAVYEDEFEAQLDNV
jgi:hypothetical protein